MMVPPDFVQRRNPARNKQRKALKLLGRRQYIRKLKRFRRALKTKQAHALA